MEDLVMGDSGDITLEDIETAVKILQMFIKRYREASIVIRHIESEFRTYRSGYMPSFNEIMNMIFQQKSAKTDETEPKIEEFTEEDLKRIREIKEKIKKGNIK